jgi:hypothetical protein
MVGGEVESVAAKMYQPVTIVRLSHFKLITEGSLGLILPH